MHAERSDMVLDPPRGGAPRSHGVHVSSLIRGLAIQTGKLKIRPGEQEELSIVEIGDNTEWWGRLDPASRLRISMGLAWEQWYLDQLSEGVLNHPREMELEGVFMTHDGESLDIVASERPGGYSHVLALHEIKLTYKSVKTVADIEGQFMWMMQCKAYCKGLGTRLAYLHINHVCGEYMRPIEPVGHIWTLEFEQREIDEAWELLMMYKRHRELHTAEALMKDTTNAHPR